jgi:hypothetical protein
MGTVCTSPPILKCPTTHTTFKLRVLDLSQTGVSEISSLLHTVRTQELHRRRRYETVHNKELIPKVIQ